MTDNGSETRPVRTLTVKNFSVIKEAKLEFGKITVLIGPQASGKSLLCKLAHFLGNEITDIAITHLRNQSSFPTFESTVKNEFSKWFPEGGWGGGVPEIAFSSWDYQVRISFLKDKRANLSFAFSGGFRGAYIERLAANITAEHSPQVNASGNLLDSLAMLSLRWLSGRGHTDRSVYIPLERSYFLDTRKGYRVLGGDPDPILASFATLFADSLSSGVDRSRTTKFLKGDISSEPGGWSFMFKDGRKLPLSELSAGSKEMLPILSVLDLFEKRLRAPDRDTGTLLGSKVDQRTYRFDDFVIEEPEASVFPRTQYDLVREIAALSNGPHFLPHFAITTHSPYILSAFNNLIEAGQAARNNPKLHHDVAKIIPEKYWVKQGDFAAYSIEDGKLKSILNESGFVEANYLDQVSEVIGDEFDKLLRLEYEHTKAS